MKSRDQNLLKARARQQAMVKAGEIVYKTPLEKFAEKPTRKYAIEAKCYDCQGGDGADSGWKWAIGNCPCDDCPLHPFRPHQRLAGTPGRGVYRDT